MQLFVILLASLPLIWAAIDESLDEEKVKDLSLNKTELDWASDLLIRLPRHASHSHVWRESQWRRFPSRRINQRRRKQKRRRRKQKSESEEKIKRRRKQKSESEETVQRRRGRKRKQRVRKQKVHYKIKETPKRRQRRRRVDKNQQLMKCCQADKRINAGCLKFCNFDAINKPNLIDAYFTKSCNGAKAIKPLLACVSSNKDHTPCCKARLGDFNGGVCNDFCYPAKNIPGTDIKYLKCLDRIADIALCFKDGFEYNAN